MDEDDLLILIEEKELEIDVLRSEFSEFQSESKEYEAELELEVAGKDDQIRKFHDKIQFCKESLTDYKTKYI